MILYFFITCIPFFVFYKSLFSLNPNHLDRKATRSEARLSLPTSSPLALLKDLIFLITSSSDRAPPITKMSPKRKASTTSKVESVEDDDDDVSAPPLLDLPELALDCILERLPPRALCSLAGVCTAMRERCVSDRLWERHMKSKWGRVLGQAAKRDWECHVASRPRQDQLARQANGSNNKQQKGLLRLLSLGWPFSWINTTKPKPDSSSDCYAKLMTSPLRADSVMAWYVSLETGKFCFPAQVYNRENGHVGFMLSCYDAQVSYDRRTDTFQARYPAHGRRAMGVESGVAWERLRAPPVDTPPHDLHLSDCLQQLTPGDHIEIQWRRNKEFPYGWWYGVVGHLESCHGNENQCRCHDSEMVVLDFKQYTVGSRWRHTRVKRKEHREEGNEADGFYGGIRKLLHHHHEISTWNSLWPTETLD